MTNLVELSIPTPAGDTSARAQAALANVQALTITTVEQYEAAATELKAIKSKWNEIDTQRKSLVKPIDEARARTQAFFSAPLGFLEQAETLLKRKLVGFQNELEQQRREEQAKLEEAARKEREKLAARAAKAEAGGKVEKAAELEQQAAMVVAPVVQREVPKVAGIKTREIWLFEVKDATKINAAFMTPDEKKIGATVRALKGDAASVIGEGVRIWKDAGIAAGAR